MKTYLLLALSLCFCISLSAQTVIAERVADLAPEGYSIAGDAVLEELDNGSLRLRLTEDFDTPVGPDVRIFLGNSLSLNGAVELVNLSDINHFEGGININVPEGTALTDYDFVLFFCVQFQQFWASGVLGDVMTIGDFNCVASSTSASNGVSTVAVCPTDGDADVIVFANDINAASGEHYAYLITDENELLQEVVLSNSYDFEGTSANTQRVYGIHYDGELAPVFGANRLQTTATACHFHSSATDFLTITKDGCAQAYECSEHATATTNWVTLVEICPTDVIDDLVDLRNNLFIPPGEHYAYLITDTNEIVQQIVYDSVYNFSGTGLEPQRVYGVNFDGTLNEDTGVHRDQITATGCFIHSSGDLFLTVAKTACDTFMCQESLTATHNWVTDVDVCATDGEPDAVFLQNNIQTPPGDHYVFLLTDTNEILQAVITDTVYNFEGTGVETQRVYGLSYAGELMPAIGEVRSNTTATECYIHSGGNLFITINKTAACATNTIDPALAAAVAVYPNPTTGLLDINLPTAFQPTQIRVYNALGALVKTQAIQASSRLQLDLSDLHTGNYWVQIGIGDQFVTRMINVNR